MSDQGPLPRNGDTGATTDELELAEVLESYLAHLEAGRPADPLALIAAHPGLARPLRACLKVMHLAQGLDEPGELSVGSLAVDCGAFVAVHPAGSSALTALWPGDDRPPHVLLPEPTGDDSPIVLTHSDGLLAAGGLTAGRYQVLGEIARGGMGVVFKARDADLGRDLALKVLLDRHRGDQDVVRRFVEEAQIGGQLQHPGIVPVHELGALEDLRPFFAMTLVKGRTLAAHLAERPGPEADLPRFLQIFEAVCQTVAYAHARRVIHRDLKPANVMVGNFGEVQVMDWGLAKVLAEGGVADEAKAARIAETAILTVRSGSAGSGSESEAGSVLGTPAYMAPEQARGDVEQIDERADVFGLGAILCEILTGRPPFVGSTREEIRDRAARGDLTDAVGRLDASGVDVDLVALAKACMAAEVGRRPRNAGAVVERVTSFLNGVQERLRLAELARVEAQARAEEEGKRRVLSDELAEEAVARARIERSRRRRTVALAASVLITASVVGGGWAYLARQRQGRATRVAIALSKVDALRIEAERAGDDLARWRTARDAAGAVEGLLLDAPDESIRRRAIELVRDVTQAAADAENDRKLLNRLVDLRSARVDDRDGWVTDLSYADAFHERGIDIATLRPADAGAKVLARPRAVRMALVAALDDWASVRLVLRRDQAGARYLNEAASLADPDPWRNRLREALETSSTDDRRTKLTELARSARIEDLPAVSLNQLGLNLLILGDPAGAETVLRAGLRHFPADAWLSLNLARCLDRLSRREEAVRYYSAARSLQPETAHELAHALEAKGETDEAIVVYEDLIGLRPEEGRHRLCMGVALKGRGRGTEANAAFEAAVVACRAAIRLKPGLPAAHLTLGFALGELGKLSEAIGADREVLRLDSSSTAAHYNLGCHLRAQGRVDEAIAEYRETLRIDPEYSEAHGNLGSIRLDQGALDEAIAEFHKMLRLKPTSSGAHTHLGAALEGKGKLAEVIAEHRVAIQLKPDNFGAHNNLGLTLIEQGKLAEAIMEFREALRLNPEDYMAHGNLAVALKQQGKPEQALAECRAALRLKPDSAEAHGNFASNLLDLGKADEAIAEYREAIRLKPENPEFDYNLGLALARQGKYDEAIAAFHEALRLKPKYAEAHVDLGIAFKEQGKLDEAITEYHEALRLKPNFARAHNSLGIVLREQGKLDAAIAQCHEALRLQPNLASAHANLGLALMKQGKLDLAIAACHEAVRLDPNSFEIHDNLGNVLKAQGKLDDAAAEFRAAIRLKPAFARGHNNLGCILQQQRKSDEAIAELREAIRLKPDESEAHFNLGVVLAGQRNLDAAVAEYRIAIRLKPEHSGAHNNLGLVLRTQGKLDEAIAEYRTVIRVKPDSFEARSNLGSALTEQGALGEAIAEWREAQRLKPDEPGIRLNIGAALSNQEKLDEAITEYHEALRLKRDYFEAHLNLASALQRQGKFVESIAEFGDAVRIKPDNAQAHYGLGYVLMMHGDLDKAIAAYRAAVRLEPGHAEAHCNLGLVFGRQSRFAEALAELKRGHELGSNSPNWQYPSAQWVRTAERLVELDRKLPAILAGKAKPSDAVETLGFAQLCSDKKLHGASARLWSAAFEAQPKLADDMRVQNRYNAACAAALAGCGQGKDDPPLDDAAKVRWRKQAMDWLKADLTAWSKILDSGRPQARQAIAQTLQHWKADTDLAGIREPAALAKLPADEQSTWRAIWSQVEALLAKSQSTKRELGQ